eukprot:CAMPEP_0172610606 /NCGR_PEP_ID=MMETSP1068-20121228/30390_1 /TAXON_ID=35684 /ORGANISM="Pseudopedinella elastica, Strain CCMP716" /LENGTH=795 /DNA_ID=CAMNT_0013414361 /DNA_START=96 /DNA_END=2483 /DNA_ORIENTATION=-
MSIARTPARVIGSIFLFSSATGFIPQNEHRIRTFDKRTRIVPPYDEWKRQQVTRASAVVAEDEEAPSEAGNAEETEASVSKISIIREGATQIGHPNRLTTIFPNDFIVHRDRGIGQFVGVEVDDGREVIKLEFGKNEPVWVGPEDRSRLSKLKSADASNPPRLTPLTPRGQKLWDDRLRKVRENAEETAQDILSLYAARNDVVRDPCPKDDARLEGFERTFAFEATPDQQRCFDDVTKDMVYSRTPMDRLVCGDVGFGKTEVALRAIYRAVLAGRQVALLAPTTVLAAQHHRTLLKRMPDVSVCFLRGGTSQSKQGKALRETIANGTAQVVVGTHALLSKTLTFHKLQLLVVDEEQRFGVAQKERLKAMATGVDVLTLTATPIPRTLQMSLSGIRDLSTLRTAPPGRKEVETHVVKFDPALVEAAIKREMARGGQVFFVVPRIAEIDRSVAVLEELIPEARVLVAHGRLNDVEQRVIAFSEGEADVLVATTVIESGLDLPNANTIIITNPHMFGLAALYQLRGRVGRSPVPAFAYFMYPPDTAMTVDALRRLQAIKELSRLGSGFELANRDLEIRGAGAIIGKQQTGAADKVGPEVYMAILQEAIEDAKGTEVTPVPSCRLTLKAAHGILKRGLPDGFLGPNGSPARELALAESSTAAMLARKPRDVVALGQKWRKMIEAESGTGTAGQLPPAVEAFLKMHLLEAFGRRLGVTDVSLQGPDLVLVTPGWSPKVWDFLRPHLYSALRKPAAFFDDEMREVRIVSLGSAPPARQLAVLLTILADLYTVLEGKENFGF